MTAQVNGPSYSRRARSALILSPDALGAALIGAAVELSGFRATYPTDEETVPDAIRRLKPAAVLVDAAHPITRDHAALGPAFMTGATLVLFGAAALLRDLRALPIAGRAVVVTLPDELDELARLLTRLAAPPASRLASE